jgi:ornithine decarboxylase
MPEANLSPGVPNGEVHSPSSVPIGYISEPNEDFLYHMAKRIIDAGEKDSFYLMDPSSALRRLDLWNQLLPNFHVHYAVKTNPSPLILKSLMQRGVGFDCASKREIQSIVEMGCDPSRIIYANPSKCPEHIRYAKE